MPKLQSTGPLDTVLQAAEIAANLLADILGDAETAERIRADVVTVRRESRPLGSMNFETGMGNR